MFFSIIFQLDGRRNALDYISCLHTFPLDIHVFILATSGALMWLLGRVGVESIADIGFDFI